MVTALFVVALSVCVNLAAGWNQQYCDASSSSYVDYHGPVYDGWTYTTEPNVSLSSPSASPDGVLFYPLKSEVLALNPNGTVLWRSDVAPDETPHLTNTLFSTTRKLVIVGASWGDNVFNMTALDAESGKTIWSTMHNDLFLATTISLSESASAVFCGGAHTNVFLAFSLINGTILWKINISSPISKSMQTKVHSDTVLLPTDPSSGDVGSGTLYALDVSAQGKMEWRSDLGFSVSGLFAFNDRGFLYGTTGGGGGPRTPALFIVEYSNGNPFRYDVGYCDGGAKFTSGPAVDPGGYGYFSCGNNMFALLATDVLRWGSQRFGPSGTSSPISPSAHPTNGLIYFIHNNLTAVIGLSWIDGSLQASYGIPKLHYVEPPILLGTSSMYLIGLENNGFASIVNIKL